MNEASPPPPCGRILVVASQRNIRAATALILMSEGHSAHQAATSEEALAFLAAHDVDLLITSLLLEPMNGFALIERAREVKPGLAVMILTGSGDPENAVRARRMGVCLYLTRSCSKDELTHGVECALAHSREFQQRQREAFIDRVTEELFDKVQALTSEPLAIEALWAGEPDRRLGLYVVTREAQASGAPRYISHELMRLGPGTDLRLFEGSMPPWPEVLVARQAGRAVARGWGIPFWFPSPQQPDDRCPHWWERDKAVRCEDCGKSFVPIPSAYPPGHLCPPCHQEQESFARLKGGNPLEGSRGVYWLLHSDSSVGFLPLPKGDLTQALAPTGKSLETLQDHTLTPTESAHLRAIIQRRLETLLTDHPPLDEARSGPLQERTLFGKSYRFDGRNNGHLRLLQLHDLYRKLELLTGEPRLSLFTDRALGPRERHVLLFLEHRGSKSTHLRDLSRYLPVLGTPHDIRKLVNSLGKQHCISLSGDGLVQLERKGRLLVQSQG